MYEQMSRTLGLSWLPCTVAATEFLALSLLASFSLLVHLMLHVLLSTSAAFANLASDKQSCKPLLHRAGVLAWGAWITQLQCAQQPLLASLAGCCMWGPLS